MLETTAARRHHHIFNPLPDLKYLLLSVGLGCAFLTVTVAAGGAVAQEDPYLKCVDVRKSKKRLQCYDTVLQEQHPEMFKKLETARKEEQLEEFGSPRSATRSKEEEELKQVDVVIIENAKSRNGKWLLVTERGQIWRQVGDKSFYLRKKPFNARLKKGTLGSFFLVITGTKRSYRVKRVK